jgi:hypothetical protein
MEAEDSLPFFLQPDRLSMLSGNVLQDTEKTGASGYIGEQ